MVKAILPMFIMIIFPKSGTKVNTENCFQLASFQFSITMLFLGFDAT